MKSQHPYSGRQAVLATMHGKERALHKAFKERLDVDVITPNAIDTDVFGSFTGEVQRRKGVRETAIDKARRGIELTGLSIGIASEGSFGRHPEIPMIPADMELMVLVDDERGLTIVETLISAETNYAHIEVERGAKIDEFLEQAMFPSHALIVRPNKSLRPGDRVQKGIVTKDRLVEAIRTSIEYSLDGKAFLQTDMRAHVNPTRMTVLEKLANRLVKRLKVLCPSCHAPGFGAVDVRRGLPCESCGMPTRWVLSEIYACECCGLTEERGRRDGLEAAGPESCHRCNP